MTHKKIDVAAEPGTEFDTERGLNQATTWVDFTGSGDFLVNVQAGWFTPSTLVVGSITELNTSGNPMIGRARMTLHNVAPYQGGVIFRVNIEWDSDLPTRIVIFYQ
ncbi:hypothetical protein [Actinomadura harenae]|uniref:Uncharacterized protein n=1 Tax=Actinomadura harenae TaxID=2483351 RepID=A0A3M2LZJ2_9ACTN|nr:hypothetical protein [Actinomadura harenae]RMI42914.1 hypothetical protein EBO15_17970 [Actinomadura harenae]